MALLVWIVLGLVSGFIASKVINKRGAGVGMDSVLGIAGAVLGGGFFNIFGMASVSAMNPYSYLVAIVGAMAVLVVYHTFIHTRTVRLALDDDAR